MNLEKEKRDKVTDLILGGAATAVLVYLLNKWLKKPNLLNKGLKEILHHTIPPIIIKSDSSEMETESDLIERNELLNNAELTPLSFRPWHYIAQNLSIEPRYVEVVKYNEDTMASVMYKPMDFPNGNLLKIWLQRYKKIEKKWEWVNKIEPQIQISRISSNSLEIELDKKLSLRQDNDHHKRPAKYKYLGGNGQILRFGKLHVSGYEPIDLIKNGDEFVISFNEH